MQLSAINSNSVETKLAANDLKRDEKEIRDCKTRSSYCSAEEYLGAGKLSEALSVAKKELAAHQQSVKQQPKDLGKYGSVAMSYDTIARIQAAEGQFSLALKSEDDALNAEPKDSTYLLLLRPASRRSRYYFNEALILFLSGHPDHAVQFCKRSLEEYPISRAFYEKPCRVIEALAEKTY